MPEPLLYWKAMGIAFASSAIVVLAMLSLRRSIDEPWLNVASIFGIGFGLVTGYAVLALNLSWPPRSGLDRLLIIVIPAVLAVELIAEFKRVPRLAAWLLRIGLSLATPRILLHGSVYFSTFSEWTPWRANVTIVACGLLCALVWSLLSWLATRSGGLSISFSLCLAIQCSGAAVMLAGYIKGGAAAIPFVASLLGVTLAVRLVVKRSGDRVKIEKSARFVAAAIIGVGVISLFSLLFIGRFFGEVSTWPAITMLLAPLSCWTTELAALRNQKPWLVASVRLAFVAIPLLIVLHAAKQKFDHEMSPLLGKQSPGNIETSRGHFVPL